MRIIRYLSAIIVLNFLAANASYAVPVSAKTGTSAVGGAAKSHGASIGTGKSTHTHTHPGGTGSK